MRNDKIKYLQSLIGAVAIIPLAFLYCFVPPTSTSPRYYLLIIECIPNAIAALIAIQAVYWFFYRQGIPNMDDSPMGEVHIKTSNTNLPSNSDEGYMRVIPEEINKAASEMTRRNEKRNVLIVIDVQNDFISGSLKAHNAATILGPLNAAIRIAESANILVVFTKDWHPSNHCSFMENYGSWPTHCVMNTPGAELDINIYRPDTSVVL